MQHKFEFRKSNKAGINAKEKYIITRGITIFLRMIGEYPSYEVWTTTASEDNGEFIACSDKKRLISAALQLGEELGSDTIPLRDTSNREFIRIFMVTINQDEKQNDIEEELNNAFSRFFEIYDAYQSAPKQTNDMKEIYQGFAIDDSGDDIYLSDGIWLSSDGSLHDRGR